MNKKIFAFCGLKESGKTTACNAVMGHFKNYGIEKMSFASPIKESARMIFNFSNDQLYGDSKEVVDDRYGLTPRYVLQKLGTEIGRNFDQDIWIKNLFTRIERSKASIILIDDCRFLNESIYLKSNGAYILGIKRPGVTPDNHQSEKELYDNWDDMVHDTLVNDSSIESFTKEAISWASKQMF
jgi:hypothetical protein